MAWQRRIPLGYEIQGGQLRPHPQEGDAVRYIFGQYLAGASLLAIAEGMTGRGPRYHQHTPEWNKHMVKRVLENARYTGSDGYPRWCPGRTSTPPRSSGVRAIPMPPCLPGSGPSRTRRCAACAGQS